MSSLVADRCKLLEERGLVKAIEDLVCDYAKTCPDDVYGFIIDWASRKKKDVVPSPLKTGSSVVAKAPAPPNGLPKATSSVTDSKAKRAFTVVVLGAADGSAVSVTSAIRSASGAPSTTLADHTKHIEGKLKLASGASTSLAGVENGTCTAVLLDTQAQSFEQSVRVAAAADTLLLVVSCKHGMSDLALRRDGKLYNCTMMAHSVGIKRAMVALVDCDDATIISATKVECSQCLVKSGFDASSPVFPFKDVPDLLAVMERLPVVPFAKYVFEDVSQFEATVMVVNGEGFSVGETITAFVGDRMSCRVESIKAILDKKTGKVLTKQPFAVRLNQVGQLRVSVWSGNARVALSQPVHRAPGRQGHRCRDSHVCRVNGYVRKRHVFCRRV